MARIPKTQNTKKGNGANLGFEEKLWPAAVVRKHERGPDFLRLANALSALYPKDSEEKRLLDAMPVVMPR